jgi:hypothetical protein
MRKKTIVFLTWNWVIIIYFFELKTNTIISVFPTKRMCLLFQGFKKKLWNRSSRTFEGPLSVAHSGQKRRWPSKRAIGSSSKEGMIWCDGIWWRGPAGGRRLATTSSRWQSEQQTEKTTPSLSFEAFRDDLPGFYSALALGERWRGGVSKKSPQVTPQKITPLLLHLCTGTRTGHQGCYIGGKLDFTFTIKWMDCWLEDICQSNVI